MKISVKAMREGYDGQKCLVHARTCVTPSGLAITTAQNLNVKGMDLFDGIKLSLNFGEFVPQEGLLPIDNGDGTVTVGCDGTPMYHQKSGKVLLIGHNAVYEKDGKEPAKAISPKPFTASLTVKSLENSDLWSFPTDFTAETDAVSA